MKPKKILNEVKAIISERGGSYGDEIEDNFKRIAEIASSVIGQDVDAHDIAMTMVCLKLVRISQAPRKRDSYIDLIAYAAFAAELIEAE